MAKSTVSKPVKIYGKTLDEWDTHWERIEGGYSVLHKDLHGVIGLHRAVEGTQVMYIGCAVQLRNKGLYTRLQNFVGPPQSSNDHTGADKIRQNSPTLHLEILRVHEGLGGWKAVGPTEKLNRLMVKRHMPKWNQRRKTFTEVNRSQ